ncbi:MAG: ABC transporter ATP-binding protein [Chloroflexi bacterium]|nr:ABC transporter ATP-binding protein [Chloroflexota bacterium]
MTADPLVQVHDLHRHFRMGTEIVRALDGVTFSVQYGEFFGVMGASGSGKSTLLYLIGGLDRPTAGQVVVNGQDITALEENDLAAYRRHTVGFVYQMFHLVPTMTALQNVEFPMIIARVPPKQRRARARRLLEMMGLGERLRHKPIELSGGQRQRVAIARALANEPSLILADEPTGNLDSRAGQEVVVLLKNLTREGRTVIIVSHDPDVIAQTDRYIRLQDGHIVEEGRP